MLPSFRILHIGSGAALRLHDVTVGNGQASFGGGIANDGGLAVLTRTTVADNLALGAAGMFNTNGGTMQLVDSDVIDNLAQGDGGGIWVDPDSTLTLDRSRILRNRSQSGAGIVAGDRTQVTITDSTIAENRASRTGGGLMSTGSVVVSGSTFSRNSAGFTTAGIWVFGSIQITNSTITENIGRGISLFGNQVDPMYVFSNTIINNHGESYDVGGLTFLGEYYPANLYIGHNIIAFNSGGSGAADCFINGFRVFHRGGTFDSDGTCFGAPLVESDIDMVLGDNGGPTRTHALPEGSAAIDGAGSCTQPRDQRGARRRFQACDSGAYERSVCGDLIVDEVDESCDPPGEAAGASGHSCRDDCTVCGDLRLDFGEACDDGNSVEDDCCSANCQRISGNKECDSCLDPPLSAIGGVQLVGDSLAWLPVPDATGYQVVVGNLSTPS